MNNWVVSLRLKADEQKNNKTGSRGIRNRVIRIKDRETKIAKD